jgi:acyl carrier protein
LSLRQILIEVFSKSIIPEEINTLKMGDLKEWDSLGNFNLILAIEQKYGIRFKIEDLDKLTSIKEIQKFLHDNLSKQ